MSVENKLSLIIGNLVVENTMLKQKTEELQEELMVLKKEKK